ncbi:hypothetical protein [Cupriavidus sp. CP313]
MRRDGCEEECHQALKAFLHAQSPHVLADRLPQSADRGSAINTALQQWRKISALQVADPFGAP